MKAFSHLIDRLERENYFSFYFSVFRIFVCVIILKDIFYSWFFADALFRGISFVSYSPFNILGFHDIDPFIRDNIPVFFSVYVFFVMLFLFGIGNNLTNVAVFLCFDLSQRLSPLTLNGGDNLMKFAIFYMIFSDTTKYFSVQATKHEGKLTDRVSFRNTLSNLAGFSIQLHLCLAYFLSAIHKIHSDVWFHGVATYYTLSLERFRGSDLNLVLAKNGLFVTLTTYFTIFVEIFFPVLVWFRQTRNAILTCGFLLHAGIFQMMMIHDFQIIFISMYGFFISNDSWMMFFRSIESKAHLLIYRYKGL